MIGAHPTYRHTGESPPTRHYENSHTTPNRHYGNSHTTHYIVLPAKAGIQSPAPLDLGLPRYPEELRR